MQDRIVDSQLKLARITGKFNLKNYGLKWLPSELFEIYELQELYVSGNQISEISSDIKMLTKLRKLDLSNNLLLELPSGIGRLVNLTELFLSNNSLYQLPTEIGRLLKLEILDLYNNRLEQLPGEMANLKNLVPNDHQQHVWGLDLRYNRFDIPDEIYYLKSPQEVIGYILDHQPQVCLDNKALPSPPPSAPPV